MSLNGASTGKCAIQQSQVAHVGEINFSAPSNESFFRRLVYLDQEDGAPVALLLKVPKRLNDLEAAPHRSW